MIELMIKGGNFREITTRYYTNWLGVAGSLLKQKGIFFVESFKQDLVPKGDAKAFTLYAYVTDELLMISYHSTLHDQIEILKNKRSLVLNVDEIRQLIGTTLDIGVNHELKFYDDPTLSPVSNQSVLKLTPEDYERYRTFFKPLHPSVPIDGWLEDYFKELCHRELAHLDTLPLCLGCS